MAIFKAQFSLAINSILIGNIKNPILIDNIKAQFSLKITKAQFTLALLKTQANYLSLFYQKPKVINSQQNTISLVLHLKVQ